MTIVSLRLTYHEKMAYIERALQNVPDRDTSSPSTSSQSSCSFDVGTRVTNTTNQSSLYEATPPPSTAAFSPYSATCRSMRSTPVTELHEASTRNTIGISPSTPRSSTYNRTRHHLNGAPEHFCTAQDQPLIIPEAGLSVAHISGE